jgi:hypothetical protein
MVDKMTKVKDLIKKKGFTTPGHLKGKGKKKTHMMHTSPNWIGDKGGKGKRY